MHEDILIKVDFFTLLLGDEEPINQCSFDFDLEKVFKKSPPTPKKSCGGQPNNYPFSAYHCWMNYVLNIYWVIHLIQPRKFFAKEELHNTLCITL